MSSPPANSENLSGDPRGERGFPSVPRTDVEASAKRKAYANIVLPLFITSIIAFLDRVNLSYAKLTMMADLQFSQSVVGLGAGIFFAGYVLFEIPGALIAERYSPKWWLARIMLSWGILSGLMAFVSTEGQFYVVRFLLGVAEASLYPVIYASCIPRWFSVQDRPRAIAVLLTSLQIATIVGSPLGGWLLGVPLFGLKGWQGLFLVEALPAIVFAFIIVWWMADSPREARWLTEEERELLTERYQAETAAAVGQKRLTVWQTLADPEVLKLSLTYFLWITGFWGATFWIPSVLKESSGWSDLKVSWMIVPPMLASLALMVWIGHNSAKTGEKRWHGAVGLFLGAAGMLVGAVTTEPTVAYCCLCLAIVGVYAPFGVWWSYPTTFLSGPAAAGAIGLINSFGNVGGFVGPYLTGYFKDLTGSYKGPWLYLGVSLATAGCLMLTLPRQSPIPKLPK
ncbi:MAG: MFS transporter [Planctomycetota bacterium]|nr:MFS transporter [Planctomycetota bacterium]